MEPEEYLVNEGQEVESPALNTEIQPEQEAKVESQVAEEPVAEVVEVVGQVVEQVAEIVDSKFVLKVGRKWFKSWSPFELCDKKSEAIVLNADKARGYKSSIAMIKRLTATIIEI